MSVNVWRLAGDTLNITCNFLYCNHQRAQRLFDYPVLSLIPTEHSLQSIIQYSLPLKQQNSLFVPCFPLVCDFQVCGSLAVTHVLVVSVIQHACHKWWLCWIVVIAAFILLKHTFLLLCDGMNSDGYGSLVVQNLWVFCISYKAVILVPSAVNSHTLSISMVVNALVVVLYCTVFVFVVKYMVCLKSSVNGTRKQTKQKIKTN
jgi:hypothetical protein